MNHRVKREIQKICSNPPFGISCNFKDDSLNSLEACVSGIPGTPYEQGVFKLHIHLTDKYPFEPPKIEFITPVYHPNVDNVGRICMDLLKMPPNGAWRPTLTIAGLLTAIQSLLAHPNPDDPLVPDIAEEFKYNKSVFEAKARNFTQKHASQKIITKDILLPVNRMPLNEIPLASENANALKRKSFINTEDKVEKRSKYE
ncbi:ubiquitin-conjugating enzyme E2 T-like [Lycorma delicatula]|uniref:ubiquitin-conjugating enzyme E2 T-like n=1 Tax=Lycorma delicatula TaxID=130591 RepID=UPI003F513FAF